MVVHGYSTQLDAAAETKPLDVAGRVAQELALQVG
jgi:hypothetical protein